jgi:dTDP-4-dehydrorhamnose reductase
MKILITGGNGNIAKIIRSNLNSEKYEITNLDRKSLNILNQNELKEYLNNNFFDILIHTAIIGGRRTKEENGEISHINILMFENLLKFANKFKMIINFDSAAIYNRNTDIINKKEDDIYNIPTDYYGFSKYVIYQRSLYYENIYNLRIFNIFHHNEENDRFIKSCFLAKKYNKNITIYEDKYFDFVYETDFIKILKHYIDNFNNTNILPKTINICYKEKYKLSEIAFIILKNNDKIKIMNSNNYNNYSGNSSKLLELNIELLGLEKSLNIYENKLNTL